MGKLVDTDELYADFRRDIMGGLNYDRILREAKPVDAVPVVHGEWVWVQYDANPKIGNFHCSKCRFIPADFNMAKQHLKYCPECGAKMDRKDGDNG